MSASDPPSGDQLGLRQFPIPAVNSVGDGIVFSSETGAESAGSVGRRVGLGAGMPAAMPGAEAVVVSGRIKPGAARALPAHPVKIRIDAKPATAGRMASHFIHCVLFSILSPFLILSIR
jgi:hypothetical protein